MSKESSSHKSLLLHFHEDGSVCPESFGKTCPHGGMVLGDPMEPATPNFLANIANNLPNGLNLPGMNGITSLFGLPGADDLAGGGGAGNFGAQANMALILAAATAGNSYLNNDPSNTASNLNPSLAAELLLGGDSAALLGIPELGGAKVAKTKLSPTAMEAHERSVSSMAQIAVSSGNPQAVIAMAKMAAEAGNSSAARAMAQMATIAQASGMKTIPPSAVMQVLAKTGLGGKQAMDAAIEAAVHTNPEGRDAAIQVQKYQANIKKQTANVEITKTLAKTGLANLSDSEVSKMTEGKFKTTQDFISYMQAPDTEVGA